MKIRASLYIVVIAALLAYPTGLAPSLSGSQESPKLPYRAEVVPGKLFVTVYAHEFEASGPKIPCWSFVSEGLERYGQHEIVITLQRPRGKKWEDYSDELFKFYGIIQGNAEKGQKIGAYDGIGLVTDGTFLGQKGTWGMICIPAEMFDGVEVPFEALAAVLVKGDEIEVMKKSSALRIASMLGLAYRYYPCPPWSDLARKPVVSVKQFAKSMLAKVEVARMPGLMVRQSFVQGNEKKVISLRVEGTVLQGLNDYLAGLPDTTMLALMTDPDPESTMRYAWIPDAGKSGAIYADLGPWATGSFVLFVVGEELEESGNEVEDGIGLVLRPATWKLLKASLASVEPAIIPIGKNGLTLATNFVQTFPVDPLAPKSFSPVSIGFVQSQEELKARLGDMSVLKDYVQVFEKAVQSALAGAEKGDACGLLVTVGLKPGKRIKVWCEAIEGTLPEATLKKLDATLARISAIEVKDGAVALVLKGDLWDRKAKSYPDSPSGWNKALEAAGQRFTTLDDLFKIIWPD